MHSLEIFSKPAERCLCRSQFLEQFMLLKFNLYPTANGGTDPYPIPWLDKNGSHNQPAGLNLEPSHIYHFKGRVARCSTFNGMGTDNNGNRIAFGSATTDYGLMQGEYWAGRTTQQGTFTHI